LQAAQSFGLIAFGALLRSVAVVHFRIWLVTALAFGAMLGSLLRAQVSDEAKRTRDEPEQNETHAASSTKPRKSPSPGAKTKATTKKSGKKHQASATPDEAPTAIPRARLANEGSKKETASSERAKKSPSPTPETKPANEKSTGDGSESASSQESPPVRKARLAKKPGEEEEATPEPPPRETPQRRADQRI